MKLLVISHTPHYQKGGQIVGWGPTVCELDALSNLFDHVTHIAPLHAGAAPASALPYQSRKIFMRFVKPAGGENFFSKLNVIANIPSYMKAILEELSKVDAVHVRCPANISLIAILLLGFVKRPAMRWVKYAGNWRPEKKDAWSNIFQRWWLARNFHRGFVTVNGNWPGQLPHVRSFMNPCLEERELPEAKNLASNKIISSPVRLLFVGGLEKTKGPEIVIETVAGLQRKNVAMKLDLVGDGPERASLEILAKKLNLSGSVHFHGWLPKPALSSFYVQSHILILPTTSEGWPKVISEGMAYGVVPIASAVSSIPQYLEQFGAGKTFDPGHTEEIAVAVENYLAHPEIWKKESQNGVAAAKFFTYENYLHEVRNLMK